MARQIITGTIIPTTDNPVSETQSVIMPESTSSAEIDKLISEISDGSNIDDQTPSTGFSLSFTNDKVYDLDAIIASIRRDNNEKALIMKVNTDSQVVQAIIDRCIEELKILYTAENLEDILNYQEIFNEYFEEHIDNYYREASAAGIEGELVINEKQTKIEVTKTDMMRYLLDDNPKSGLVRPIIDYTKAIAVWTELGAGDLTEDEDINTREIYEARIAALEALIAEM